MDCYLAGDAQNLPSALFPTRLLSFASNYHIEDNVYFKLGGVATCQFCFRSVFDQFVSFLLNCVLLFAIIVHRLFEKEKKEN